MIPLLLAAAVVADIQNLTFGVTYSEARGNAVEQVRQAASRMSKNLVSVTAFVLAGEDLNAVRSALDAQVVLRGRPVLAVVGVGGLPEPGAKVVLEHVSAGRAHNLHGIAFVAGQPASSEKPAEVVPLVEKSFADLRKAHAAAAIDGADVLRVTCYMSSLADINAVRRLAEKEFPKAARNYVQLVRSADRGFVECETVVRLRSAPGEALKLVQPEGLSRSPNYSHVAMLGPGKVVFSGGHYAAGIQDSDARALFSSLDKALAAVGSGLRHVAMSSLYPTSTAAAELIRRIRFDFYDRTRPPASTMLVFESLPDAAPFAANVVASVSRR
jgi:enamine deaminase RidA (YjgF/YER057c/UK114 family)